MKMNEKIMKSDKIKLEPKKMVLGKLLSVEVLLTKQDFQLQN